MQHTWANSGTTPTLATGPSVTVAPTQQHAGATILGAASAALALTTAKLFRPGNHRTDTPPMAVVVYSKGV